MSPQSTGTGFAPDPPDDGFEPGIGKKGASRRVIPSDGEVPLYAAPVALCLRFLPARWGTQFVVQVVDLATGHVLDEAAPRALAELPRALAETIRWVFCP